jgi:perosamine synthetase
MGAALIPYGRQSVDQDDVDAVVAVLRGDWLTQGPEVEAFERDVAEYVGAQWAVAFSSGTAALHGAAAAAGLGAGHQVAVPALTFVASANCARYLGAGVELIDIDPATLNLDPRNVPEGVDALVAVHFAGLPAVWDPAGAPRVVIEDAAHALGAIGPDGPVGNCARSDMCVFSFHPVKSITTGEGGMVTTNSEELADRLRRFRNHGIRRPPDGSWAYEISDTGFNYRLSDIHAALGRRQLLRLERFVERRNQLAERYDELLADLPVILPPPATSGWRHARHLYPVQVRRRAEVYRSMRSSGIGVQVHYVPLHHHPLFSRPDGWSLPATDRVYEGLLSLPLHPELEESQQDRVVEALVAAVDGEDGEVLR